MSNIFISYSKKDIALANNIRLALKSVGLSVWWDDNLVSGNPWKEEIHKALKNSDIILVIWTNQSKKSDWVKHEASIALLKGNLIQLHFGDINSIPEIFKTIQSSNLENWNFRENDLNFKELLYSIYNKIKKQKYKKYSLGITIATVLLIFVTMFIYDREVSLIKVKNIIQENNKKKPFTPINELTNIDASENIEQIKAILQKNTDGRLPVNLIRYFLQIGSNYENTKFGYHSESARHSKYLKKYKFVNFEYLQNTYNNDFTMKYTLTDDGNKLYSLLINELVNNIDYEKELKPVIFPDKSIKYSKINKEFYSLSAAEREFFILKSSPGVITSYADNGSTRDRNLKKLVQNKLYKKDLEVSKHGSISNKNRTRYVITEMGRRVNVQIFGILVSRLSEQLFD